MTNTEYENQMPLLVKQNRRIVTLHLTTPNYPTHETRVTLPNGFTYTLCSREFYKYIGLNQYGQMIGGSTVSEVKPCKYLAKVF